MKQLVRVAGIVFVLALIAAPASAKELGGRFAVGGGYSLLGNGGLQAKFYPTPLFGVALITSYANISQQQKVGDKTGDNTAAESDVSLRVLVNAAMAKDTHFYVGAGMTMGTLSRTYADASMPAEDWTQLGFEGILGVEHFLNNHFSLTFETGIPFHMATDDHGFTIGQVTGGMPFSSGAGQGRYMRVGGLSPAFASSFNFYF